MPPKILTDSTPLDILARWPLADPDGAQELESKKAECADLVGAIAKKDADLEGKAAECDALEGTVEDLRVQLAQKQKELAEERTRAAGAPLFADRESVAKLEAQVAELTREIHAHARTERQARNPAANGSFSPLRDGTAVPTATSPILKVASKTLVVDGREYKMGPARWSHLHELARRRVQNIHDGYWKLPDQTARKLLGRWLQERGLLEILERTKSSKGWCFVSVPSIDAQE